MARDNALWTAIVVWVAAAQGIAGCATTESPRGDETHFQTCTVDSDCTDAGAGYRCESGTCRAAGNDAGAGGRGGAVGSGGRGGGSGGLSSGGESAICHLIGVTDGDSDAAAVAAILGDAAQSCVLHASDYDRTCTKDSDCVLVGEGNGCTVPCGVKCPNTAINARDLSKYQADYDRTPFSACEILCGCGALFGPFCYQGTCEAGMAPTPTSTDAGRVDSGPP